MRKKTKLLSMVTASVMIFSTLISPLPTSAAEIPTTETINLTQEQQEAIINILSYIEQDKTNMGLENIDFSDISTGTPVHMYEYLSDGLHEIRKGIPLYYHEAIVAFAFELEDSSFQISTLLANKLNKMNINQAAIVYTMDDCYVCDGTDFIPLYLDNIEPLDRKEFSTEIFNEINTLELTELHSYTSLDYSSSVNEQERIQTYFSCDVKYITQKPYDKICWAASTAMIVNYLKGTSYTAVDVAKTKYGNDFNYGLDTDKVVVLMNDTYEIGYNYHDIGPSEAVVLENIKAGYPLYAAVSINGGGHAVVIFAVNPVLGYFSFFDPLQGAISVSSNGSSSSFVDENTGKTYTFLRTICKNWTN